MWVASREKNKKKKYVDDENLGISKENESVARAMADEDRGTKRTASAADDEASAAEAVVEAAVEEGDEPPAKRQKVTGDADETADLLPDDDDDLADLGMNNAQ